MVKAIYCRHTYVNFINTLGRMDSLGTRRKPKTYRIKWHIAIWHSALVAEHTLSLYKIRARRVMLWYSNTPCHSTRFEHTQSCYEIRTHRVILWYSNQSCHFARFDHTDSNTSFYYARFEQILSFARFEHTDSISPYHSARFGYTVSCDEIWTQFLSFCEIRIHEP